MALTTSSLTRRWIVAGLALIFVAQLIQVIRNVQNGLLSQGDLRFILVQFLEPVGGLFAAGGWWFLSRIDAHNAEQRRLISRGYFFVALELACTSLVGFLILWESGFSRIAQFESWFQIVGAAIASVGLITTSHLVRSGRRSHVLVSQEQPQ